MFSQDFLNEVKDKIDMVELVSEYTPLHKAGALIYQGRCPHPDHEDSTPSFRVFKKGYRNGNKVNKYDSWACMGCHSGNKKIKDKNNRNYGSDCFAFYQWIEGVTWKQAVYDLCEKYNISIPSSEFDKLFKIKKIQTDSFIKNLYEKPLNYLHSRGLTSKDIELWKIGYDGNKIVFPLPDRYWNILGFTKRWIEVPEGRNDKYKNSCSSKIFNKSSYFYGQHNIINDFDEIRITEGPMDVIMAHKYGAKNINATLGTAFTDQHVEVIKQLDKVPVLIMDGDARGIEAGQRAINKLAEAGIYSKILILPNGKDLCELSLELKEGIEEYISSNSMTYGQYKLNNIINSFDSEVNELKLKKYSEVKKTLDEIPHEVERMIMKEYVLKRLNMRI